MFRSLFRTVTPHLKKGLAHVGKRALTAGANALSDMSENNTSIKDALKTQVKNEIATVLTNPINRVKKGGKPPKRKKKKPRKTLDTSITI